MDVKMTAAMLLFAAAFAGALMALEQWIRSEGSVWTRLWWTYKEWYDEQAAYLFEPRPAVEAAKQHLIIAVGALIGGGVVALLLTPNPLVIVAMFALGIIYPFLEMRGRVQKRRQELLLQIDPALQFMANALQAAPNLEEALLLVAQHMKPPMAQEVRRVVSAYRLGKSLDEALQEMADRCNEPFITSMVMALIVGRRTGGNVALTLRDIALSTREVTKVELDLRTKTKGQQNQFYLVLVLYPVGVMALKEMLPSAWTTLAHTTQGLMAFLGSALVVVVSFVWARSILSAKNL